MRPPAWIGAQPYAHRGLHGAGIPENTLAAFAAAIAGGYGIELDVQPSRDGVAMVFHDDTLNRLAGVDAAIATKSAAELAPLRVGGTDEIIPTLAQTLAFVADRAPLLIEIKNERARPGVIEAAVALALADYRGRAAVMSWNVLSMAWFVKHAADVPRGVVVTPFWRSSSFSRHLLPRLASLPPPEWLADPAFLAHDISALPSRRSRRFRKAGKPVLTWTVRTPQQRQRAGQFADAPIFEMPISR